MKIKRALLETTQGKAPEVMTAIRDYAAREKVEGIIVNHIVGDMLSLHAPEDHFEILKRTQGVIASENARPVFPAKNRSPVR